MAADEASSRWKPGRRDFLGAGLAAAVGLGLGVTLASGSSGPGIEWSEVAGYPDRPVYLRVSPPDGATGVASVEMVVTTPLETLTIEVGRYRLGDEPLVVPATLAYPYDDLVTGSYRYRGRIVLGDLELVTRVPAAYEVRPMYWLS